MVQYNSMRAMKQGRYSQYPLWTFCSQFLKSEKNDTFFQKIFILNNDIDLMANIIVHKSIISIQHHPYSHVDLFSSQYGSIVVVVT